MHIREAEKPSGPQVVFPNLVSSTLQEHTARAISEDGDLWRFPRTPRV